MTDWYRSCSMAAEYGLYPTYKEEFHTVFSEFSVVEEFKKLMVRMKVVDANGESAIDEEQWEATSAFCSGYISPSWRLTSFIDIYIAFAFEKREKR